MPSFLNNFASYIRGIFYGIRHIPHFRLSYLRKVFSLMGKREKITASLLLMVALVNLFLSIRSFYRAHTVLAPSYGGVYVEGEVGQPGYINPLLATSQTDLSLEKLVYSGLYKFDGNGQLVPDLADGQPAVSDDQKQYVINLKHNVKWHNDRPFTADDVVFTIQALQNPNYKSPLRPLWMSTTVEKLNDYQIKFSTKDISGPFLYNLTLPILPKSVWENVNPQVFLTSINNLQAVGTGPFTIKEIKKQESGKVDQIALDSFANYYGGKPKIDSIIIKFYDSSDDLLNALHSKEVEGLGFTSSDSTLHIDASGDVQITTIPLPQYQVLFYNLNNKILSDVAVRQALSQAVNRQGILDSIFKDTAQMPGAPFTFTPSHVPGDTIAFNMQAAGATLDAAGWKVDPTTGIRTKKNVQFQITLATNDSLINSKTAQAIVDSWKNLNIKVNLTVLPTQTLTDNYIRPRKFDTLVFPIKLGADPDPFIFWHSSQAKDPGLNLTGFADSNADKLINQARSSTNQQTRENFYEQFAQLLNQKMPALFLNQSQYQYAIDKGVQNVSLNTLYDPSDRFYDSTNWFIQEKRVWK